MDASHSTGVGRIRRVGYEPAPAQPAPAQPAPAEVAPVVVCPRCDGPVTPAAAVMGAARPAATNPADLDAAPARSEAERSEIEPVLAGVLQLVLEVLGGRRPVGQLDHVTAPRVGRYIRAAHLGHAGPVARLRSLRTCSPTAHVAEVAAVVGYPDRVRAVAARFEYRPGGWRCVTFRIL